MKSIQKIRKILSVAMTFLMLLSCVEPFAGTYGSAVYGEAQEVTEAAASTASQDLDQNLDAQPSDDTGSQVEEPNSSDSGASGASEKSASTDDADDSGSQASESRSDKDESEQAAGKAEKKEKNDKAAKTEAELKYRDLDVVLSEDAYTELQKTGRNAGEELPTIAFSNMSRFWMSLTGEEAALPTKEEIAERARKDVPVEVTVKALAPEGVRAEVDYIEPSDEIFDSNSEEANADADTENEAPAEQDAESSEKSLFGLEITLVDKDGNIYVPAKNEPIEVTIKGGKLKSELKDKHPAVIYAYAENEDRNEEYTKKYRSVLEHDGKDEYYAADVLAYESEDFDRARRMYEPYDKDRSYADGSDAVRYIEAKDVLSTNKDTITFTYDYTVLAKAASSDKNPDEESTIKLVIAAQQPENSEAERKGKIDNSLEKIESTDEFAEKKDETSDKEEATEENEKSDDKVKQQTLTSSNGKTYKITVKYGADAGIPEDAELRVEEISKKDPTYSDYIDAASSVLLKESYDVTMAHAFDISLVDNKTGEHYQPDEQVKVSIKLLKEDMTAEVDISVVHFKDEKTETDEESTFEGSLGTSIPFMNEMAKNAEVLNAEVNKNGVLEFESGSFSVYVIIEHEENTKVVTPRVEFHFIDRYSDEQYTNGIDVTQETTASPYNFANLNGTYQTTQIIKNGETLELINDPRNITVSGNEKYFYGWYVVDASNDTTVLNQDTGKYEGTITFMWPDGPDHIKFEQALSIEGGTGANDPLQIGDKVRWTMSGVSGEATLDEQGTAHVYLAPLYEDFYFINFHKGTVDSEESLKKSLVVRKLVVFGSGTSASVRIGNVMCESSDPTHQIFNGWQEEKPDGHGGYTYNTYHTVDHTIDEHGDIKNVERKHPDPEGSNGYYITVNKTTKEVFHMDLYPVFDEARWIYFKRGATGNGSTYVGASYRLSNDDRSSTDNSAYYYLNSTFFAGGDNTQSHMSRRAGYNLEGWYLFADMDDTSGDIKNMSESRSVTVDIVDISAKSTSNISDVSVTTGGTTASATSFEVKNDGVISINVPLQAIKLVNSDGTFAQADGYSQTVTYKINGETKTVKLFAMEGGVLRFYKAMDSMTIYANWVEHANTTYRVIVWKQKVTDDPGTQDEHKSYDYEVVYNSNEVSTSNNVNPANFTGTYVDENKVTHNAPNNLTGLALPASNPAGGEGYKGFQYNSAKSDMSGTPNPDGTTVYNIYYDRIEYTLRIYFARSSETTSGGTYTYTEVAAINNGAIRWESGYSYDSGEEYYRDTRGNRAYYYSYAFYNNANHNAYQRINSGSIYIRTMTGGTTTKTFQTSASSTAHNDVTEFFHGSNNSNPTTCGSTIKDISDLCTYDNIGTWVDTQHSEGPYTYYYYPITALYGQDISAVWPEYAYFNGNGTSSNNKATSIVMMLGAKGITGGATSGGDVTVKGKITIMDEQILAKLDEPDGNFMWQRYGQGNDWRYYIWLEQMPGVDYSNYALSFTDHDGSTKNLTHAQSVQTKNNKNYYLNEVVLVRSGSTNQHAPSYEGFDPQSNLTVQQNSPAYRMDYFYERNVSELTFNVNYPQGAGITYSGEPSEDRIDSVPYGASLLSYGSSKTEDVTHWYYGIVDSDNTADHTLIAPDHYIFGGWYEDAACTVPFNFNTTMPAANKVIYAKWTPEKFWVKINPNGGEINRVNQTDDYYFNQLKRLGGVEIDLFHDDYFQFDQYYGASTDYFPGNGNISTGQSTYFDADYNETTNEYVVPRRFVAMSDSAADEYEADGNKVYYYVNYQLQPTDGVAGVYTHVRSAIYLTDEEISKFYTLYEACVNVSLSPQYAAQNEGMVLLDEDTWRSMYVSSTRYRPVNSSEHWTFLGWYKTPDGGEEESMPYNFTDPVTGNFTLTAHWRLDGGYTIDYIPQYTMPDGAKINGTMPSWYDPADGTMTYADGAETEIYKAPTNLTKTTTQEGTVQIKDDSVIFRGWALVNKKADGTYEPAEKDSEGRITTYYYPSDPYTVNAASAGNDSKIYFQAIYQYKGSSDRQPKITNLKLDANGGYVNAGYDSITPDLPSWDDYPGISAVNTTDHKVTVDGNSVPTQILFGDIQSSAKMHLYKYATDAGVIKADGYNYFTNTNGHFLLGFDDDSTEGDYIATYPADSLIAITRNDDKTIYAVWEPMVYMTFKNETDKDIQFSLAPVDPTQTAALEIINIRNGMYDRKKLSDYSSITLKAAGDPDGLDTVTFAFPKGAEKEIKISGTNNLGVGKVLMWDSSLTIGGKTYNTKTATGSANESYPHTTQDEGKHEHTLVAGEVDNTQPFDFVESLIVNENPVTVTFTSRSNDYALIFNDNFPAASGFTGSTQEIDFPKEQVLTSADPVGTKTYSPLPDPNSCPGYQFKGWASAPDATVPDFVGSINDMQTFFEVDWNPRVNTQLVNSDQTVQRILYAVWEEYDEESTVYVFKNVPTPGNQEKDFTFHVAINAGYTPLMGIETTFSATGDFFLRHNQYAKLYTEQHTGTSPVKVTMEVRLYNATNNTRVNPSLGDDPDLTISASKPVNVTGGTMTKTEISVTEQDETYYVASIKRQSQKLGNGINLEGTKTSEDPLTVTGTSINWNSVQQQGTVIYTNQRDVYDVTVNKTLVSNTSAQHNFNYTATYEENGEVTTLYSAASPLIVTSGSSSIIEDVPAGTKLTVAEITDEDDNYAIETSATYTSGANVGEAITDGDNNNQNVAFVITNLTGDVSLSYTNTLKSYKVTMKLVDQNGDPLHAMFALSSTLGSLGTTYYAGDGGVFYTSNKFWADTYTLDQTTTPSGYLSPQGTPVTLKVTGNGITSNNSWVTVTGNVTDGYIVTVKNWKQVNLTVKKVMNDVLLTGQRTFNFTYSYKSAVDDKTVNGTFELKPTANNQAGVSQTLKIPIDSTDFKVEETADDTYDTEVTYLGGTDGSDTPTIVSVKYRESMPPTETTPSCAIIPVEESGSITNKIAHNATITFTNTRRTINLTVKKTIKGEDRTGSFEFVTTLINGDDPISSAEVGKDNTGNTLITDADGKIRFYLSHHDTQIIRVPVGANVTVGEILTPAQKEKDFQAFMMVSDGSESLVSGDSAVFNLHAPSTDTTLHVFNIPCICKVTDGSDNLLYRSDDNGTPLDNTDDIYIPAIFATIRDAFGHINNKNLYKKVSTSQYEPYEQDPEIVYPYKVKMLVDYEVPDSDVVSVDAGLNLTFTTAERIASDGYPFRRDGEYTGDASSYIPSGLSVGKAVLTRKTSENKQDALFTISNDTASQGTIFKMTDLIINGSGANLKESVRGGCVTAYKSDVTIENCLIYKFEAAEGGAVYTTGDSLTVENSIFDTCVSSKDGNGYGGGAINTTATVFSITETEFLNCSAVYQGGAVYHHGKVTGTNIDTSGKDKVASFTRCRFENCSSQAGGGIEADVSNVTVDSCTFVSCSVTGDGGRGGNGGGLNNYTGDFSDYDSVMTVTDCTFQGCTGSKGSSGNAPAMGGGMRIDALSTTVTNCSFIDGGDTETPIHTKAVSGGGIAFSNNKEGSAATVSDCTFTNCAASSNGGGIYSETASLIVNKKDNNNSSFTGCTAKNGGGVYSSGNSTDVSGTTLNNCTATAGTGGGVHASSLTASGIDIQSCTASSNGGGIYVSGNGNISDNSQILYCIASGGNGGGVYSGGELTLADTTITGHETLTDESVKNANTGGGVYAATTLTATDTIVQNCKTSGSGGGIYISGNGNISESSQILYCIASNNGGGVYSEGELTIADTIIKGHETLTSGSANNARNGGGVYAASTFTVSDTIIQNCKASSNGGGIYANNGGSVTGTSEKPSNIKYCKAGSNSNGGGIYMGSGTLTVGVNTTVMGYETGSEVVNAKQGGGIFVNTGTLTLGGTIENCQANTGGGIYVNNEGDLEFSGNISTCKATGNGGGIFVTGDNAIVNISGGNINGNSANGYGGGAIRVESGANVTISSGSITGNYITGANEKCGAAIGIKQGTVEISGGTISGNYAIGSGDGKTNPVQGGAIFVDKNESAAKLTISGGTITNNHVEATHTNGLAYGGAINVKSGGTVTISGGTISGNYVTATKSDNAKGAGIYLAEGAHFNIEGSPYFGTDEYKGADTENDGVYTFTEGEGIGNCLTTDLPADSTNGGQAYSKARQDIYLAGTQTNTINVTDNIRSGIGAIWVWAEESTRIHQDEQFAIHVVDKNVSETSLHAFRNARADKDSGAASSPYYGVKSSKSGEENYVIWGTINETGSRKVILRKVSSGYTPVKDKTFTVYKGSATSAYVVKDTSETLDPDHLKSSANGVFWVGTLPYGWYIIEETDPNTFFYLVVTSNGVFEGPADAGGTARPAAETAAQTVYSANK